MVQNMHQPADTWERLRCTPLAWFDTYDKARQKLPQAEETSDLQSDTERRRKRPMRWEPDETDSEEADCSATTSNQQGSLKRQKTTKAVTESDGSSDEAAVLESPPHPPLIINVPSRSRYYIFYFYLSQVTMSERCAHMRSSLLKKHHGNHAAEIQGMQKELFRVLHTIKAKQVEQSVQLDFIVAKLSQNTQSVEEPSGDMVTEQFNTVEDFLNFDSSLENEEMQKKLKKQWKKCDGGNIYNALQRVLQQLMSDKVAEKFSFQGGKGKRKFCKLRCWPILVGRLCANEDLAATEYKVEKALKSYLAHAKECLDKQQLEK
ncbi:unnamed protein product [Ixodes hexagonus]